MALPVVRDLDNADADLLQYAQHVDVAADRLGVLHSDDDADAAGGLGTPDVARACNQLQVAAVVQRAKAGELRMYLGSWGSYSINDVSAVLPNFFDGGADDYARDPDVIKWLSEGGSSNEALARKKNS